MLLYVIQPTDKRILQAYSEAMKQVTAQEAFSAIHDKKNTILLDVRTSEEFARAHIEGAINIPLDSLQKDIEQFLPDKKKQVYVYCMSGSRSHVAAMVMEQLGYQHVFDIKSGLLAWRIQKYPLVM